MRLDGSRCCGAVRFSVEAPAPAPVDETPEPSADAMAAFLAAAAPAVDAAHCAHDLLEMRLFRS